MPDRVELADALGRPVLAFTAGAYQGRPRATAVEVLGDGAADVVLVALAGWLVNGPVGLGLELVARGARVQRHAHTLTLDLDGWSRPAVEPPAGLRFTACDRPAADLLAAHLVAYAQGHVDNHGETADQSLDELAGLMSGDLVGPLLGYSRLAVDRDGAVVAGCLVTDLARMPFVTDVFRDPARSPAGTGAALLTAVLAAAAGARVPRIGLAVTEGNPARRVYERLGFTLESTSLSVLVPG